MKKILIFSLAYFPHVGGAEVAIKELTDRIHDIEFHMITMRFSASEPKEEKIGNVYVYRVGSSGSYSSKILYIPRAVFAAMKLELRNFDGMWAMMSYMMFPIVVLRVFFRIRIPYILTLQEGDPFEHVFKRWYIKIFSPLLTHGFMHASAITTISNFLAQWPRSMGYTGQLILIPNGVDVQHFAGETIPHQGSVLVTASRLVHKNALDDVIRALTMLPTIHFKIAGTGIEENKLRQLAQELHVEDRVEFLGHIDHARLPHILHEADIFIRPSRSEGMGNAFIEAMAAGMPVIGTHVGGIPDFLKDGETGFVVEVDNPKSIAGAVQRILENPTHTEGVVKRAKELSSQYDWAMLGTRMREAFELLWNKK